MLAMWRGVVCVHVAVKGISISGCEFFPFVEEEEEEEVRELAPMDL